MTDLSPISTLTLPRIEHYSGADSSHRASEPTLDRNRADDSVELSLMGRLMKRLNDIPEVRLDLVESVRAKIAAGGYESPDRLAVAVDRLFHDL